MAEMLTGELLHMEPAHLITLAETETAAARLQSSSAVLELGKQLLHAAREGNTAEVLALMSKGAPFTTDWLGTSPLHLAAMNAHEETCSVLLRAGISRDTRTKVERTPLHLAAYEGHASLCSLLLDHGAQHDSRDMLQMTPLHWAVERGHGECARVLLQAGADPHATCKFLRTPLSMAAAAGDAELLQLMQQALLDRLHRESEASARAIHHPDPEPVNQMEVEEDPLLAEESGDAAAAAAAGGRGGGGSAHRLVKMLPPQAECSAATEALLRRHGIAMLPADNSNTLISALQSGRRVVLSDAGKLMLKESEGSRLAGVRAPAAAAKLSPAPAPAPTPAPTKIARIFTINGNQLLPVQRAGAAVEAVRVRRAAVLPLPAPAPAARAPLAAGRLIPLKLPSQGGAEAAAGARAGGARRGAVIDLEQLRSLQREGVLKLRSAGDGRKILIHRNTFGRLASASLRADHQPRDTATLKYAKIVGGGEVSERVPAAGGAAEAAAEAGEVARLRAELGAARAAQAELEREVRSLRRRLLLYEPASAD